MFTRAFHPARTVGLLLALAPASLLTAADLAQKPAPLRAPAANARTVLLLQSARSTNPSALEMTNSFRQRLEADYPGPVDLHVEYLALAGAGDPYARLLAEFLREKYAHRSLDALVAIDPPAVDFALAHRAAVFPGVPLVYAEITRNSPAPLARPPNSTGLALDLAGQRTVRVAVDLQPDVRRVVLVAGAAPADLALAKFAQRLVQERMPGLAIESLAGQALEQQLARLSSLPPQSLVIFVDFTADTRGQATVARDVLQRASAVANAPIFGAAETYLGYGIVGGDLIRFGKIASQTADLCARVLAGEPAEAVPALHMPSSDLMFDARELRRWGIREAQLPAGSTVLFRPPDLWSEHWKSILLIVGFLVAETLLLGALLIERRHRRGAESRVREAEQRYRTVADFTHDWEYWQRPDESFAYLSPSCLRITGYAAEEYYRRPALLEEIVVPEDRARWTEHSRRVLAGAVAATQIEIRIRRADGEVRWLDHASSPVTGDDGRFLGVRGSSRDISDRKQGEEELRRAFIEIGQLRERLEAENTYLREQVEPEPGFEGIVGRSDALRYVLSKVSQVAPTRSSVLLLGETGVGKELVAHAIHSLSPRRSRPLVKLNCAALPASLVESELFGHEKGAFTGAIGLRKGRFEIANGSTLFLDEIGELPLALQATLLRVIQDGEFERVGGTTTLRTDVRLVAATNRQLDEEVAAGRFREDLWYRLNVFPITVPPLRQRKEDIPVLVRHFLDKHCRRLGRPDLEVSRATLLDLEAQDWPGNVRELESVIERAVISSPGPALRLGEERRATARKETATQALPAANPTKLTELEAAHILTTLEKVFWRLEGEGGAAKLLGIHPSTLRSRMHKLGIRRPGSRPEVASS